LHELLKAAYDANIKRVYLVSSSSSYCDTSENAKRIVALVQNHSDIPVYVIQLGHHSESHQNVLRDVATLSGGRLIVVDGEKDLVDRWIDMMEPKYRLVSEGRELAEASFNEVAYELTPGRYALELPFQQTIKTVPFSVAPGQNLTWHLGIEQSKLKITESNLIKNSN
jgi:hypothetical protein